MVVVSIGSVLASGRAGEEEAMTEARQLTEVIARTVVEPNLSDALIAGDPAALASLDQIITDRVIVGTTVRVKLWSADGRIIYSDEPRLIGEVYELERDKNESLRSGAVTAEISSLEGPENRFEADADRLLEVYLPLYGPESGPVLYESYFDFSEVSDASSRIRSAFIPILLGSLVIMQVLHLAFAWGLHRRLQRGRIERERLLQRALDASDLERRRIAGDLHDGVVQDLVATSFAISAAAETASNESPELATDLRAAAVGARRSLQSLRSLLVDIYPANLKTQGLEAALTDLLEPVSSLGIETDLSVETDENLSLESTALIYRVVQESMRNVLHHAEATTVAVAVTRSEDRMVSTVRDDGKGFVATESNDGDHLGLRFLSDLAADAGAALSVESNPGSGTTIRLEVPA
jgi:two-component system NarL family sensor kinase